MLHHLLPVALLGAACAPLFAQTPGSLRAPLQAWLAHQEDAALYEDWFVPFRKALLDAKSTKCLHVPNGGTDPLLYDLVPVIELDDGMENFAAEHGTLPESGVTNLLNLAGSFRANGDSLEPLLPWLLLLHKRGGADARLELCLFEAWGTDALDCAASKAAAVRLAKLDEAPLLEFLHEAAAFPKDKPGTALRLVNQLCADKVDKGAPLGAGALGRALVDDFEKDYELAMQLGDFAAAQACLKAMMLANPKDWSAQLMLEASGAPPKGTRFVDCYKEASPAERAAINARLQHLGLGIVAPGETVVAVAQTVLGGPLDFFRNDLGDRVKKLDAPLKASEKAYAAKVKAVADLREDIAELERKIKKHERIVGMRREVRDWRQRIEDKTAEAVKLDVEASKALEAKAGVEAQRNEVQGQIDAVKKRRSEFKLQPTAGEPARDEPELEAPPAATGGQPPAAAPPAPPDTPAPQLAPVTPPLVDFDVTLPQGKELREATAHLDRGRLEPARTAFEAVKVELARLPAADATAQRLLAVTSYRLGETLQGLGKQKARETLNDVEAERLFRAADAEFEGLPGDDFGTEREGSSLHAAALRARIQVHSMLYGGYRDLAKAKPNTQIYRQKRDAARTTANRLIAELKDSFATATLPNGRTVLDVACEEAAAAVER